MSFLLMKNYSKSIKKYIRTEKARIRRQFLDLKRQETEIANLYKKIEQKPSEATVSEAKNNSIKSEKVTKV